MSLKETIEKDLVAAMRAKDEIRLNTLRQVKSAMLYKQVEGTKTDTCDDATVMKIIATLAKQRRDSIDQFRAGGRNDLADKEAAELAIIETYLPAAMPEADIQAIITAVVAANTVTGPAAMGAVMKAVMAQVAGRADGKVVSALVKKSVVG